uniref:Uncharacterized protein n=1 Tax=Trichogramma kaykai TaxID=54128 RepID=A0ABD2WEG0_9HYME
MLLQRRRAVTALLPPLNSVIYWDAFDVAAAAETECCISDDGACAAPTTTTIGTTNLCLDCGSSRAYTPVRCVECTYIGYIVNSRARRVQSRALVQHLSYNMRLALSMVQNSHYVRGSSLTARETNKSRKRGTHAGRARGSNTRGKFIEILQRARWGIKIMNHTIERAI